MRNAAPVVPAVSALAGALVSAAVSLMRGAADPCLCPEAVVDHAATPALPDWLDEPVQCLLLGLLLLPAAELLVLIRRIWARGLASFNAPAVARPRSLPPLP